MMVSTSLRLLTVAAAVLAPGLAQAQEAYSFNMAAQYAAPSIAVTNAPVPPQQQQQQQQQGPVPTLPETTAPAYETPAPTTPEPATPAPVTPEPSPATPSVTPSIALTPNATSSSSTSTGKVTVTPYKNNCVTIGFKDCQGAITDGEIVTATVSLNPKCRASPPSSVEVSGNIVCGRNKFTFDAAEVSSFEQQVTCRTSISSKGKFGKVVDLPITFKYPTGKSEKQIAKQTVIPVARCEFYGDPHVISFDGAKFEFMKVGVYRLFQSRSLLVQGFFQKCNQKVSDRGWTCTRGIAVAFGSSVVRVHVDNDQKMIVAKGTGSAADWLSVERLSGKTEAYRIFVNADHSTFVDVSLYKTMYGPYLNAVIQVSPLMRATDAEGGMPGACGSWNGISKDDAGNVDQVAAAQTANLTDNLFTCVNEGCAAWTKPVTTHDEMCKSIRVESETKPYHQNYVQVGADQLPLKTVDVTDTRPYANWVTYDRALSEGSVTTEEATKLCRRVLVDEIPICSKYVSGDVQSEFVDKVCAFDAVAFGDLASVVDSAKIAYLRECRREMDARVAGVEASAESAAVAADRESMHFGDLSQCLASCSGRGDCLSSGCKCANGFTGLACEITVK